MVERLKIEYPTQGSEQFLAFFTGARYWICLYDQAKAKTKSNKVKTEHGRVAEARVRNWLASFLPKRYGVTPFSRAIPLHSLVWRRFIEGCYIVYVAPLLLVGRIGRRRSGVCAIAVNRISEEHHLGAVHRATGKAMSWQRWSNCSKLRRSHVNSYEACLRQPVLLLCRLYRRACRQANGDREHCCVAWTLSHLYNS